MLPQKNRLNKKKDFERVFKKGKTAFGGFLGIKYFKNKEIPNSRFGVIVSNKISKKAVERNLIKRRIKAILSREYVNNLLFDVIIITLPNIKNKSASEISRELASCFKKITKRS